MDIFEYTTDELDALRRKDKRLAAAIDRIGPISRAVNRDLFAALVDSIVAQQISRKAADTVDARLLALCREITPESICRASTLDVQKCGMSMRKAQYIKGIGDAAISGALDLAALPDMPDDAVIAHLSALNGIGVWTAEMLLIFSLCRRDVLSYGDLAIRRGICKLYGHKSVTKEQFERYRKRYSPYGSIASLYLWELSTD